ncbi:hypothetical protein CLOM_g2804 [Closterium sp. NIES-68]|nr:hypothetical protein CLOM_g2804 [Closterium sp. NIES-68]
MRSPRVVRGKKVHAAEDRDWLSDDDSFLDSEEMEWDDGDFVDGPHTAVDQPTRAEVNQQGQAWQLPSSTHQPSSSQGRRQRHVPTSVPCTSQQAPGDELLTAEVPLVIGTTCAATDTEYMIKAIEILFFLASNEGFTMWPTSNKILDALFIALGWRGEEERMFLTLVYALDTTRRRHVHHVFVAQARTQHSIRNGSIR